MIVTIEALPDSLQAFKAMPQMALTAPEQTCAMLICALNLYGRDPEAGLEALDLLRGPRPMTGYDRQFIKDRFRGKPYLPRAYFLGADPANDYSPERPFRLSVLPDPTGQNLGAGMKKVFLETAGADRPRPVTLRQKGEQWLLWEYSSILSGIRTPAALDPWA